MNLKSLAHKNIIFFARYYKLAGLAALIAVAVITGSLVAGDSVRATLTDRVNQRLGSTQTIVFSRNSFMDEGLPDHPVFGGAAKGILLADGFLSHDGRLTPVMVWGVDDMSVAGDAALPNEALRKELGPESRPVVLRLPAPGLAPSGSLFVTNTYTTAMRLNAEGVVTPEEGGNMNMKNDHAIPFNIFVNRRALAEAMGAPNKINIILCDNMITDEEVKQAWHFSSSGLTATRYEGFTEITSDRIFLQDEAVQTICAANGEPDRLFSYLANSIEHAELSVPYSFVTAMDRYKGQPLDSGDIILSDYTAQRLKAGKGDSILVTYFTAGELKTLRSDTVTLCVKSIVPLGELRDDKTLSADFPGLSNVERCTEWDSNLPIDMGLITVEDEKYWELYNSTPKAVIAWAAVAGDWSNVYGTATAIRVQNTDPDLSGLRPSMFGIEVIHPRHQGLYAAMNGVDFSGLFLTLGFFIILSAVLLMLIPLSEMMRRRENETALLKALGYPARRITKLRWTEGVAVLMTAAAVGVVAGLLYTSVIMWLLGTLWRGATHTEGFAVYPRAITIATGLFTGLALTMWTLRRAVRQKNDRRRQASTVKLTSKTGKALAIIYSLLAVTVTAANFIFIQSAVLFVITGVLLIGAAATWGYRLTGVKGKPHAPFDSSKMTWATLLAGRRQALISFLSLTGGVFIVFSVGLHRKGFGDSSKLSTGTGGYSLWCETTVPIYHNMATNEGRDMLSLSSLPPGSETLQCLRYKADEASCLNLNKVTAPTVLGVDMSALAAGSLRVNRSLYPQDRDSFFKAMQAKTDSVYPALVDETVLKWSLGIELGDTLYYRGDNGRRIAVVMTGTLATSVFQGNILIHKPLFSEIWYETTGSEVFLVKVDEQEQEEVKTLLAQALSEYGIRVTTTAGRLRQFNTVTDTYLTIFMTLGGLGLLLGIISVIVVIRKSLAARREEIVMYKSMGFSEDKIGKLLYKESLLVPFYALATGVVCSLAGTGGALMNAGTSTWITAVFFVVLIFSAILIFIKICVKTEVAKAKQLNINTL